MSRKVLIGYNDSPQGEDALALGQELAETLEASAGVLTVVRHPRHGVSDEELNAAVSEYCDPLFSAAREKLEGIKVVEYPVVSPSRSRAFYAIAEEEPPELIVIGSTRRGPLGRVLLGSLGDSLLSGAPCAVAVAPSGYSERKGPLERIGVAVDGNSEAWRALDAGLTLAGHTGKPLRLLSVVDPPNYALGGLLSSFSPEQYHQFKERETEDLLRKAVERADSDVPIETTVLHGDPAEALAEAGEGLDLLLVGSRGYGPITHTLLGGVSSKLMATAPCAVMVVPRAAGPHPLAD